jgi:radical SAM superfamily enzyme YgiQ (UPF0313 family)
VVRGRGERALPDLLARLEAGRPVDDVPGLAWLDRGLVRKNALGPQVHPDQLPPVPYERVDVRRYLRPSFVGARTAVHHSSYGCPLECGFCAVAAVYEGRWLAESPARVLAHLERLIAHGADGVEFFDNNFFAAEKRAVAVARGLEGRRFGFWGEGTVRSLLGYSDEGMRALARGGCKMIFFGVESGAPETLALMNKSEQSPDDAVALARRLERWGIVPEFSFVLGAASATSRRRSRSCGA